MEAKEAKCADRPAGICGQPPAAPFLGLGLSAVSMVCSMIPYLCIWLAARDLIAVAPDWTQARA